MCVFEKHNNSLITDLKKESKYNYKKYTRQEEDGSRTYNVGNKKIPSVTTILVPHKVTKKRQGLISGEKEWDM